jgi:hypothetical protein
VDESAERAQHLHVEKVRRVQDLVISIQPALDA